LKATVVWVYILDEGDRERIQNLGEGVVGKWRKWENFIKTNFRKVC
jgi:hypothetical protein